MSGDCCAPPGSTTVESAASAPDRPARWWRDRTLALPVASGVLVALGFVCEWSGWHSAALVWQWCALLAGGWTFAPAALRNLIQHRFLGVSLLMTIAAVGAVALGRVGEAAALAFLFSIAEALEDRAMDRARSGLGALLTLMPQRARLRRDGAVVTVPSEQVRAGDIVVVGAGERLATDGVVAIGQSSLDTSAITGESIPVEVGVGDAVAAGAINGAGTVEVRATADGTDNSLTTIVRLVQEAHAQKGDRARLADRIARPLVPTVLIAAALIAVVGSLLGDPGTWIERALVVLVAASPCALAIAVPVTVISSIGSASKLGVIIKSGQALEQYGAIRQVAMDKTGTLTRNDPQVVHVATAHGVQQQRVLDVAGALESASTHPLAAAIMKRTVGDPGAVRDREEVAGHGITGVLGTDVYRVGAPRWVDPGLLGDDARAMSADGMSLVVVEENATPIAVIGIRDELRPEAAETVRRLRSGGVSVTMLTGDSEATAAALAAQAGIVDVRATQRPADKAAAIRRMSEREPTAMVGDGINDAPALAAATVGIAMGVNGSAAAIESADVAFVGHDLRLIPASIEHARRGRRIMTGNILLALAIIVVLFPLALFGVLGLAAVVLVHEVAEVVIILNGTRAARLHGLQKLPPLRTEARAPIEHAPMGAPPTKGSDAVAPTCGSGCCGPAAVGDARP